MNADENADENTENWMMDLLCSEVEQNVIASDSEQLDNDDTFLTSDDIEELMGSPAT